MQPKMFDVFKRLFIACAYVIMAVTAWPASSSFATLGQIWKLPIFWATHHFTVRLWRGNVKMLSLLVQSGVNVDANNQRWFHRRCTLQPGRAAKCSWPQALLRI